MSQKLLFCSACHHPHVLTGQKHSCPFCNEKIDKRDLLHSSNALGLIGFMNSGKSVYLATLHDQLMHSAPDWGVEVSDRAFGEFTRGYQYLRKGMWLPKTSYPHYFLMKVIWQKRKLDLIMWDVPGEEYERLNSSTLWHSLQLCRSIMVAIMCPRIKGIPEFTFPSSREEDESLGLLFRRLLHYNDDLRQVIVLLVGVDVYGNTPDQANRVALKAFASTYRIFPGVLKNAGIHIEPVPLSNIGFGNIDPNNIGRLCAPPKPYNVLEPLRRVYSVYLPWWRQKLFYFTKTNETGSVSNVRFEPELNSDRLTEASGAGSAFISYRREGGAETARLIRSDLRARRWRVFLDVEDLKSGYFDQRLWLEINAADNFILILSPHCLDRCIDNKDWFRREIAYAIRTGKNIVPILKDGFKFPPEESLPKDIRELLRYNSVEYSHSYFHAATDKLVSFLKKWPH